MLISFRSYTLYLFSYLLLLLLPANSFTYSAEQNISGFIYDESNGEALIGANVYLQETDLGTSTNKEGYYVINDILSGKYILVVSYVGYRQYKTEIEISDNEFIILNIDLKPQVFEGEEIVVTADRQEDEIKTSSINVDPLKLQRAPQMAEADLMRTLQLLPGVLTLSEFSSGLYIRGGTPDQNLILLDGTEVYNVNHLFGVFSTFDVDAVKNVELIKGGFPAQYGGRLSSVLDITNMDGNRKHFQGKASLGLISAKASLQGPLGNGAWFFSGRRTYVDYIVNGLKNISSGSFKEDLQLIPDYYFYDAHLKIYQDLNQNNKLSLTLYAGQDNLHFKYDPVEFTFKWGNQAVTAKWTHIFTQKLFANFYATYSHYRSDINRDDAFFKAKIENPVNDVTIRGDLEYFPLKSHHMKLGLAFKYLSSDYFQQFNKQEVFISSGGNRYSLYLQDNWEATQRLRLQGGLRLNYYDPAIFENTYDRAEFYGENRFDLEPRLAFRYRLQKKTFLKGSWGKYLQYINIVPFGNIDFSFLDIWFPSDNSYNPSDAFHYNFGIETELPYLVHFDSEIYYKDMDNLYEFKSGVNEVLKGEDMFYRGGGYAFGADFFLEKNIGDFAGWFSYSLGWTKRKFTEVNQGKEYFPKYDRRNAVNIVGTYKFSPRWSFNLAWTYGTGQAYTRAVGYYRLDYLGRPVSLVQGEEKNIARLPDYHRMDISFRYESKADESFLKQWAFYFQIFNIYNHKNVWFRNVNFNLNADPPAAPEVVEVRMLPILPTFGFEFYY